MEHFPGKSISIFHEKHEKIIQLGFYDICQAKEWDQNYSLQIAAQ